MLCSFVTDATDLTRESSGTNTIDSRNTSERIRDRRPPAELIGAAHDPVLFVRIDVALASGDAQGQVLFLLDIASLDSFREAIRRAVANL